MRKKTFWGIFFSIFEKKFLVEEKCVTVYAATTKISIWPYKAPHAAIEQETDLIPTPCMKNRIFFQFVLGAGRSFFCTKIFLTYKRSLDFSQAKTFLQFVTVSGSKTLYIIVENTLTMLLKPITISRIIITQRKLILSVRHETTIRKL